MNNLVITLLIPFFTVYVVDFAGLIEKLKVYLFYRKYHRSTRYIYKQWKPLDCSSCLTFWLTLIFLSITTPLAPSALANLVFLILLSTFTGYIAIILRKWIN